MVSYIFPSCVVLGGYSAFMNGNIYDQSSAALLFGQTVIIFVKPD